MFEARFQKLVTLRSSTKVIELCRQAVNSAEDEVLFNLQDVRFITPFGVTVLAGHIREYQRAGKKVKYRRPQEIKTKGYHSDIGFHSYFRLNNHHEESRITRVDLKQIFGIDVSYIEGLLEVMNHQMNLSRGMSYTINLSLNELITNVDDHSETPIGCFACAQYTPASQLIRICIADFGIGILEALRKAPKYKTLQNSAEAIKLAVEPGVSSRVKRAEGLGLTHIRNFLKINQGTLSIISGDSKVNFYYNKIVGRSMPVPFPGTIVKLRINSDKESLYFLKEEEHFLF